MRKNLLLFFTLITSFIFTSMVGSFVFFDGILPRLNQQLVKGIIRDLTNLGKYPALPSIRISPGTNHPESSKEFLARCLRDHHFIMYGIDECGACNLQRGYFGSSFNLVKYVNCNNDAEVCNSKNIRSYPTWEDEKGNKYKGAISLEVLAQLSGCQFTK